MPEQPTPQQILDCPMDPKKNDAEASTVRDYLLTLLATVWEDGEGFSGKRPFGNSSWEFEVYSALGRGGFVTYTEDDDGYAQDVDEETAHRLVAEAIRSMR